MKRIAFLVVPLVLLAGFIAVFLVWKPLKPKAGLPPVEKIAVERAVLEPGKISLRLLNDGPDPVTISQVLVNDSYWVFTVRPNPVLGRLGRAELEIPYPWIEGEPQKVTLVTSTGATFIEEIAVAVSTPRPDASYIGTLGFLGFAIGVIPVFLGLLWMPFLRSLKNVWYAFFLALTLGLLLFLGVDSLVEGLDIAAETPDSFMGTGVLTIGFALAFLSIYALGQREKLKAREAGREEDREERSMRISWAIAVGIGVHNLGEGLAVGGAYASGNVALGALLVVGFMVHNITEGVAVIAPVSRAKPPIARLALMGLVAGAPAIPGAWIGGFAYSAVWAVFFLGVGAGAIFQVFVEILGYMAGSMKPERAAVTAGKGAETSGRMPSGGLESLLTVRNAAGFLAGLIVMYGTGLLVAA